jgi:hypothetical protein
MWVCGFIFARHYRKSKCASYRYIIFIEKWRILYQFINRTKAAWIYQITRGYYIYRCVYNWIWFFFVLRNELLLNPSDFVKRATLSSIFFFPWIEIINTHFVPCFQSLQINASFSLVLYKRETWTKNKRKILRNKIISIFIRKKGIQVCICTFSQKSWWENRLCFQILL